MPRLIPRSLAGCFALLGIVVFLAGVLAAHAQEDGLGEQPRKAPEDEITVADLFSLCAPEWQAERVWIAVYLDDEAQEKIGWEAVADMVRRRLSVARIYGGEVEHESFIGAEILTRVRHFLIHEPCLVASVERRIKGLRAFWGGCGWIQAPNG